MSESEWKKVSKRDRLGEKKDENPTLWKSSINVLINSTHFTDIWFSLNPS